MNDFYAGCVTGLALGVLGAIIVGAYRRAPVRPGISFVVSAEASNALYRALRCLGYSTQNQTADIVELVESWVTGENLEKVVERLQAENEE